MYTSPNRSIPHGCQGVSTTDTLGGPQETNIISESGLYALNFTSRKDEVRRFRKWVTGEVLPALRREGRYELPGRREALPAGKPSSLRLKQTVKATCLTCAVQLLKMRDGHPDEIEAEFERLCSLVAEPDEPDPAGEEDSVNAWIAACVEPAPMKREHRVQAGALYDRYCRWCAARLHERPVSMRAWGLRMRERFDYLDSRLVYYFVRLSNG